MKKIRIDDNDDDLDVGEIHDRDQEDEIETPPENELEEFRMRRRPREKRGRNDEVGPNPPLKTMNQPIRRSNRNTRIILYGILAINVIVVILIISLMVQISQLEPSIANTSKVLNSTNNTESNKKITPDINAKIEGLNERVGKIEKQIQDVNETKKAPITTDNNQSKQK